MTVFFDDNDDDELDPIHYNVVTVDGSETHDSSCFDNLPEYNIWKVCFEHRVPGGLLPLRVNDTRYELDCKQMYDYLVRLRDMDDGSNLRYVIHKSVVDAVVFGIGNDEYAN